MSKGLSHHYSGTKGHIVSIASSLPQNGSALEKQGRIEISHPNQAMAGHHIYKDTASELRIRYNEPIPGDAGSERKGHFHILNLDAVDKNDMHLNKMTLCEFSKYYNFHNSSIVNMQFNAVQHMVILKIELPWLQQNTYQDGDPEIIEKIFQFVEVSDFECPHDILYEQVGIFTVNADDNLIIIYVVNHFTNEEFTIKIVASSVIEITEIPKSTSTVTIGSA